LRAYRTLKFLLLDEPTQGLWVRVIDRSPSVSEAV
jgi:hypothetical protein